ncbi:homoserine O-acetyltransferase [Alteromonas sp. 345S023]|uniref:Probable acyltransferase n=1 Tax=Alteromonas profundi TaxID=2696062 RepID=A0A7X5LKH6_9ALTE|nr:homoserine O-acetyltransferase [Alteromonas profundi]NDV90996.1 homoserine O-acetyltransferase [Alteromonas profundi]
MQYHYLKFRPGTWLGWLSVACILVTLLAQQLKAETAPVAAQKNAPLLVEKQVFSLPTFTTFGGKTIENVNVGWEAYGSLTPEKDNVVLITHYFSGTSHAAGKYHSDDAAPGYWDNIIGPGKAIDTDRFYVVSVDSLVNLNAYDEHVVTTGPASINPKTGQPYGLDFPVVTIRDFVNVQKALLESLGINKLHAVVGPSMGSMQAIEWASAYPSWVPRMVSVIGAGESDAWTTAALEHWAIPIRLDSHWNNGDYTQDNPPTQGLAAALMLITQDALTPTFFNQQGEQLGFKNLEQGPLESINHSHSIVGWLKQRALERSKKMDANHLLYLVRACQLFVAGHKQNLEQGLTDVKAKTLFIPAQSDLLLMPYLAQDAHKRLTDNGVTSHYLTLPGALGHLEGVVNASAHADAIREFLKSE